MGYLQLLSIPSKQEGTQARHQLITPNQGEWILWDLTREKLGKSTGKDENVDWRNPLECSGKSGFQPDALNHKQY